MQGTIVICGFGSGISSAVADRFGKEGYKVALVSRSADKLEAGAKALVAAGIEAQAFPCNLADGNAVSRMIGQVRERLGPIAVLHWNAYQGGAGDLATADVAELRTSLVVAVQAALPDLRTQPDAAVLVTGGGLSFYDPKIDAMAVEWKAMGLAIAKASQHKAVGVLHHRLKPESIYVGEVVVLGSVKGTAWDHGNATLEASAIAERFWQLSRERTESTVNIS
jgi:NAD(P)-dependent dehydrogenase (short-subunit alcohol dehydrogenase family)